MPPKAKGFTLVEMLVVVVIIGVLAMTVTLSAGDHAPRVARQEAQTLVRNIDYLKTLAGSDGSVYGLRFDSMSYQPMRWSEGQWTTLDKRLRQFDGALSVDLWSENVVLAYRSAADLSPQIVIFSDEETTPFRLHFKDRQRSVLRLESDGLNGVTVDER